MCFRVRNSEEEVCVKFPRRGRRRPRTRSLCGSSVDSLCEMGSALPSHSCSCCPPPPTNKLAFQKRRKKCACEDFEKFLLPFFCPCSFLPSSLCNIKNWVIKDAGQNGGTILEQNNCNRLQMIQGGRIPFSHFQPSSLYGVIRIGLPSIKM